MKTATWNGVTLAKSDDIVLVEGNPYFPMSSLEMKHFEKSATHTTCPWKGEASYFTIEVDGKKNVDAAWYYPQPKDAAKDILNRVAFWKGVEVR